VLQNASELAIAASDNGRHAVLYSNAGGVTSHDFGATWEKFVFVVNGTVYQSGGGDPSAGWGPSGAFYVSGMGASSPGHSSVKVWVSNNNGASFGFGSFTQICEPLTAPDGCIADYPHMAVDRHNQAGGQDQVYVVSRRLNGWAKPAISCSADGGKTWPSMVLLSAGFGADHGRPIVGRDGSVYVVYMVGNSVLLDRFSSCQRGLSLEATSTVAADGAVACPIPGQELCDADDVAIQSSPMVAADDADPAHVYVAYAAATAAGNEDVLVADSLDRGETWTGLARANAQVPARRFMPWVCATSGAAQVTWYDRRAGTAENNDLTSYYRATVAGKGATLAGVDEQDLAGANDPQCRSGWPCRTYAIDAAESCSVQPQLAGVCQDAAGKNGASCDFSDNNCPAGQTCTVVIPTCRRYGDYTGNGCAAGRLFAAWSSAVPPAGVSAPAGIQLYASAVQVGPICGERDLACCAGNVCDDHLVCIERSVSLPTPHVATTCECGNAAQPCCLAEPHCQSGLRCDAQQKCVSTAPPPPCGAKGERCCAQGAACAQGLTCIESRCVAPPPDPCATCREVEQACIEGCSGDASCACRCRQVLCQCQQGHSCAAHCIPQGC
jgi:hypothetical protein